MREMASLTPSAQVALPAPRGSWFTCAAASTMRVVRCRVRCSRSGQRAALPRRSRQVPSRGSNQRPSGRQRSSIPCGRRHRSHSPPARSNRTRRLSSGPVLGIQRPQFGANWHSRIQHAVPICVQDQPKKGGPGLGAAKGREESRGSPRWRPSRRASVAQLTSGTQIGVGIGWPGAGSGRGGGSIGGGGAGLGSGRGTGCCCGTCCPPLTPDLLVLATKHLRKLLGALLGVRPVKITASQPPSPSLVDSSRRRRRLPWHDGFGAFTSFTHHFHSPHPE